MSALSDLAQAVDESIGQARSSLVHAVRQAHREGMTQIDIAYEIGRSQPEVSRLLHFHGTSPRAMALRKHRREVLATIHEAGGSNLRVFGSVAKGEDTDGSDIDLVFTIDSTFSLFDIVRLELKVADLVGYDVDLVPDSDLIPVIRERVLAEAVAL